MQWSRTGNDGSLLEGATGNATRDRRDAVLVDDDVRTHRVKGVRETETIFVDRLVNNGLPFGLRHRDDEGLLPVRHKAGVHVGFDDHWLERAARVPEANAVFHYRELTAHLAENVEERQKFWLLRASNENVALGCESSGRPRGSFVAVEQGTVFVSSQAIDALNENGAIGFDPNDGAHLLEDRDEVHDLGLNRRVLEFGDTFCANGREKDLFGRANGREGQIDLGASKTFRRGEVNPLRKFGDLGAKRTECIEVEIDRAVADSTPTEVGDECFPELVEKRTTKQDGNSTRASVGVDLGKVGAPHIAGIHRELTVARVGDPHSVRFEEPPDDGNVRDCWNSAQH